MNKNVKILFVILILVLFSVVLLSVFTQIQNKRISDLRQTLDSLDTGKQDQLNQKYFNPGSEANDSGQSTNQP